MVHLRAKNESLPVAVGVTVEISFKRVSSSLNPAGIPLIKPEKASSSDESENRLRNNDAGRSASRGGTEQASPCDLVVVLASHRCILLELCRAPQPPKKSNPAEPAFGMLPSE